MIITTIRIPSTLHEMLIKQADKDKRSINKEVIYIIERYLELVRWNNKR